MTVPDKAEHAKAQLVIATGLIVIFYFFKHPAILAAAAILGLVCIFIPLAGELIVKYWFKLAEVLGKINGAILLTIIFLVVLVPVALIARLNKKDALALKRNQTGSLFHERNHKFEAKDLENVW
ncbi:SxtJ family membrane protein [Dyadobacter crusticola]|uniref:SxtJ family membrane protein n=1 Tax=Dyadobacter crusticola TaxID=292407 RepID=UPI0004E115DE|nr:SxtJ family membrane protein [Dyadobacter crusticola]